MSSVCGEIGIWTRYLLHRRQRVYLYGLRHWALKISKTWFWDNNWPNRCTRWAGYFTVPLRGGALPFPLDFFASFPWKSDYLESLTISVYFLFTYSFHKCKVSVRGHYQSGSTYNTELKLLFFFLPTVWQCRILAYFSGFFLPIFDILSHFYLLFPISMKKFCLRRAMVQLG